MENYECGFIGVKLKWKLIKTEIEASIGGKLHNTFRGEGGESRSAENCVTLLGAIWSYS